MSSLVRGALFNGVILVAIIYGILELLLQISEVVGKYLNYNSLWNLEVANLDS